MTEKVEVGEWYKNKNTGKICRVTRKLLFNTCIVYIEENQEIEFHDTYKRFCKNWIGEEEGLNR